MTDAMYSLIYLIESLVDMGFKITLLIFIYKCINSPHTNANPTNNNVISSGK